MAQTTYYNFSGECINSNYIGFSSSYPYIILTPSSIGSSFYFPSVSGCILGCNNIPSELSGCFKVISTGITPTYPVFSQLQSTGFFPSVGTCLENNPCENQQEVVYFKYCCPQQKNPQDDYYGILTDSGIFQLGSTYLITISTISDCATVVNSTEVPNGIVVYQDISYDYQLYSSCQSCTGDTGGCGPLQPTPTPTIYYSSDTRCGDGILKRNSCEPIVIFPMGVQCVGTNPTLTTIPDGSLSLIITGGTPPYTVTWSTGGNGLFLTNLGVGSYSSVVVDYYGDFTAYTTCTLTAPGPPPTETIVTNTPTVTQTVTPTSDPNYPSFCLTLTNQRPSQTINMYFTYTGELLNSMPQYSSNNNYNIYWSIDQYPNSWVLDGTLTQGNVINYSTNITPLTGWEFLDPQNQGSVTGILGECAAYGNLCFTYRQIKGPGDPLYEGVIDLFYVGQVNGYPSWQSSDGTYILAWQTTNGGRWVIDFTTNPKYVNPTNTNPAVPPLTGWQQPGAQPPSFAIIYEGNCTPTTTVGTADLSGGSNTTSGGGGVVGGGVAGNTSGLVSGNNLGGALTTSNPTSGDIPFNDNVGRDGTTTTNAYQCECIAVRTISTFPGTAFYTDCDGNPAQIAVPGGSGVNARACICRRVGTTVSGGVIEEPCQTAQSAGGQTTITNYCLDILGDSCNQNVTGGGTRSAVTTAEDTGIVNNGNITFRASGGYPPYQYSIDGGLTYKSSPLFSKLGAGTYQTVIKDSSGNTFSNNITLLGPPRPTIYQVSLQTSSLIPRSASNVTTRQFTSTIKVTPDLPDGVVLTFDLIHTGTFRRSPSFTAATLVTNTLLKKNLFTYSASTVLSGTGNTLNTSSGCQQKVIYVDNLTETWEDVKYSKTDTLSLITSTSVTRNSIDKCYVGESIDNFILTNLTISGCSNCGVSNITV